MAAPADIQILLPFQQLAGLVKHLQKILQRQ
jgi:hypothetical protein